MGDLNKEQRMEDLQEVSMKEDYIRETLGPMIRFFTERLEKMEEKMDKILSTRRDLGGITQKKVTISVIEVNENSFVDSSNFCKALGVNQRTLLRYRKDHIISFCKHPYKTRGYLYPLSELERFLKQKHNKELQ